MESTKKYAQCFLEMFGISEEQLETLEYQSIQAWDSVGHMNLMGVLEEEFEVEMEIDDIVDFSSYKKGMQILSKYQVTFDG